MSDAASYMKYKSNWLSQFGLYRYESTKPKNQLRKPPIGLFFVIVMACIVIFIVFLILKNFLPTTPLIIIEEKEKNLSTTTMTVNHQIDHHLGHIVEMTTPFNPHLNITETTSLLNKPKNNNKNATIDQKDIHAEKLVHKPSRHLRPPPPQQFRHSVNRRQFEEMQYLTKSRPRPFNFELNGPPPAAFQKTAQSSYPKIPKDYTGNVNSIQDILEQINNNSNTQIYAMNHNHASGSSIGESNRIKFTGIYRHPKINDYTRVLDPVRKTTPIPLIPQSTPFIYADDSTKKNIVDPFHNYKPLTPSEINLLATKQFRFAPYLYRSIKAAPSTTSSTLLNYPHNQVFYPSYGPTPSDAENMYHQLIHVNNNNNNNRLKQTETDRIESNVQHRHKPFSLMLDIYPMPADEEVNQKRPSKNLNKHRMPQAYLPQAPSINAINNLPYSSLDNSYFNSMNFPQIQHNRFPMGSNFYNNMYFRNPFTNRDHLNSYQQQQEHFSSGDANNKPSQMIVHLNLYPKNKQRQGKNRAIEILSRDVDADKRASNEMDTAFIETENKNQTSTGEDIRPQIYFHSKPSHEYDISAEPRNEHESVSILENPSSTSQSPYSSVTTEIPKATATVEIIKSIEIDPKIDFDNVDIESEFSFNYDLKNISESTEEEYTIHPIIVFPSLPPNSRRNRLEINIPTEATKENGNPFSHSNFNDENFNIDREQIHNSQQPDNAMTVSSNNNIDIFRNDDFMTFENRTSIDYEDKFKIPKDDIINFEHKDAINSPTGKDTI